MPARHRFYKRLADLNEFKFDFSLERIKTVLLLLNSPQNSYDCVHIAGSNGKGSTAWYLSNILKEHGHKVGTYTSPHFTDVKERIAINGLKVNESIFISEGLKLFQILNKYNIKLTYFEFLTVLAFLIFKVEKVSVAVIEAGLGGRYDATNMEYKHKLLSVITSISLEHTDYLGKTKLLILKEKAEIIGTGKAVVNVRDKGLKKYVKGKYGNKVIFANEFYPVKRIVYEQGLIKAIYKNISLQTKMIEPIQADNLATVLSCLKVLNKAGYKFEQKKIKRAVINTVIPGRFTKNTKGYFLSVAHNPEAFKEVLRALNMSSHGIPTIIVFSLLKDKDAEAIFNHASKYKNISFVLTGIDNPRAISIAKMKQYVVKYGISYQIEKDNLVALKVARKMAGNGIVLIGGSFYLVSKFM
ncbi:MAG: Mur ligase family protein [bacterium]